MTLIEEKSIVTNHKTAFRVNTQNGADAGKLASTLLGMSEIGRVAFDLAIVSLKNEFSIKLL